MASAEQIEEEQIKSIFQFTLDNAESSKLFFLSTLAQRIRSSNQSLGNVHPNASACQLCGKLWPNDQIVFHRAICAMLTPDQRAQSSVLI